MAFLSHLTTIRITLVLTLDRIIYISPPAHTDHAPMSPVLNPTCELMILNAYRIALVISALRTGDQWLF